MGELLVIQEYSMSQRLLMNQVKGSKSFILNAPLLGKVYELNIHGGSCINIPSITLIDKL